MMGLLFLGVFLFAPPLVLGLAAGWFARGFVRGRTERSQLMLETGETRRLELLVEQIRHDAYEHMTLDSRLAPIIVDTIRTSELERQRLTAQSPITSPRLPPQQ